MRLAIKAIAASLLAALAAGSVVAQSSPIEPVSFGQRRPLLGFAPCQNCAPSPSSPLPFDLNPPTSADPQNQAPPMPGIDPGAQASLAGTGGGRATALPQSIGDLGSYYRVLTNVTVPVFTTTTTSVTTNGSFTPPGTVTTTTQTMSRTTISVLDYATARAGSGFKIGDNESPRPMDRISFTYNGYFNTPASVPFGQGQITSKSTVNGFDGLGQPTVTQTSSTTTITGQPGRTVDVHRGLLAFEKTLLDGNASVGIRLPTFGTTGGSNNDPNFIGNAFGDLSLIAKYALINNRDTNNLISVGLVLTLPTGPAIQTVDGNLDSVLIQPFVGYIYNFGGAGYLQGFSSIVVPTNSNDVTAWFNDVGIGYVVFRNFNPNALLTAIIPTVECHVTTPLNQRGSGGVVQAFDIVSMTGGVHLGMGRQSWLTIGVNAPVTGPQPYGVEGIVQFNYRF